jgi:Flp pilus assembly pilin Flp
VKSFVRKVRFGKRDGASAVSTGLLVALIAVIISVIFALGGGLSKLFNNTKRYFQRNRLLVAGRPRWSDH